MTVVHRCLGMDIMLAYYLAYCVLTILDLLKQDQKNNIHMKVK